MQFAWRTRPLRPSRLATSADDDSDLTDYEGSSAQADGASAGLPAAVADTTVDGGGPLVGLAPADVARRSVWWIVRASGSVPVKQPAARSRELDRELFGERNARVWQRQLLLLASFARSRSDRLDDAAGSVVDRQRGGLVTRRTRPVLSRIGVAGRQGQQDEEWRSSSHHHAV